VKEAVFQRAQPGSRWQAHGRFGPAGALDRSSQIGRIERSGELCLKCDTPEVDHSDAAGGRGRAGQGRGDRRGGAEAGDYRADLLPMAKAIRRCATRAGEGLRGVIERRAARRVARRGDLPRVARSQGSDRSIASRLTQSGSTAHSATDPRPPKRSRRLPRPPLRRSRNRP